MGEGSAALLLKNTTSFRTYVQYAEHIEGPIQNLRVHDHEFMFSILNTGIDLRAGNPYSMYTILNCVRNAEQAVTAEVEMWGNPRVRIFEVGGDAFTSCL